MGLRLSKNTLLSSVAAILLIVTFLQYGKYAINIEIFLIFVSTPNYVSFDYIFQRPLKTRGSGTEVCQCFLSAPLRSLIRNLHHGNGYDVLLTQRYRQKLILEGCRTNSPKNKTFPKFFLKNMYVSDERGFMYCLVPKVASTNWKRTIAILSGKVTQNQARQMDDSLGVDRNPACWIHNRTIFQHFGVRSLGTYTLEEVISVSNNSPMAIYV